MTTPETFSDEDLQARLANLRNVAIANGVKFVSEAELREIAQRRAERRIDGRNRRSPFAGRKFDGGPPQGVRSSCPPEADREFSPAQGAAFASAPESAKEALLDYAALTDVLHGFLGKKHFGQWFKNTELLMMLEAVCGRRVNNFNNVMSKLRARYEAEGLALDVDTDAVSATVWRVRVCAREESRRLQRENPSRK